MDTSDVKELFLKYFRKHGYKFLPPSKVWNNDPTLLFVNSGMVQLKNYFLGNEEPTKENTKMMNYQHCIRAGGKHNDLDDVGKDSYHLTSFIMNGVWQLKDFNKYEIIELTYKFLVDECKLSKDNIYVTYFEGDNEMHEDLETFEIWQKFVDKEKIIKGNTKDNFWQMAEYGPCGPCTEVHYDLIGNRDASKLVNNNDPTVVEIWNNVFMQYNKTEKGYEKLKNQYLDQGAGNERITMIMQGKTSIYQTDIFTPLIGYAQILSKAQFYTDKYDNNKIDTAYRIFADHIRTTILCLHQDVDFDATKRGFVLRKIFRRLLANLYIHLNNCVIKQSMNKQLIDCLISDVLNGFGFRDYDVKKIKDKLIQEELTYINRLKSLKSKYKKYKKDNLSDEQIKESMKKNDGVDEIFIENINNIQIIN